MMQRLINWYGKSAVYGFIATLVLLTGVGIYLYADTEPAAQPETKGTAVRVSSVASLANGRTLELIGNVEAVSQTTVTAETSGRVVRVNVSLGDAVRAGQVLGELENASERAAVLQAEGVYESALASAAQGDVGVDEAQNALASAEANAVTTYKNAFNTFRTVLVNDVDDLFTDPRNNFPGLRITGGANTAFLNNERVRFQTVLDEWQARVNTITIEGSLQDELAYARARLEELARMLDILLVRVNDDDAVGVFTATELQSISTTLSGDRATLNNTLSSIDTALSALANAREAQRRAELGGTNTEISTANAQVKQALGSLRAAQANLEKTILRSSIAGTVNSLSIKTGDFISTNAVVARVANNDALEVTSYVSEAERNNIAVGDTVTLAGDYEGTITNIAPAVDPETRKIEVKIAAATSALENGDTVRITLDTSDVTAQENAPLSIPITALKVETDRTVVFTVENNTLVAHPVTLGPLQGSNILIESGITPEMEIVVDARGFNEGDEVTITN